MVLSIGIWIAYAISHEGGGPTTLDGRERHRHRGDLGPEVMPKLEKKAPLICVKPKHIASRRNTDQGRVRVEAVA